METKSVRLQPGMIVKHFKREFNPTGLQYLYLILHFGKHSETKEDLVIYKSLADGGIYARPMEMFMSKTDKEKYPQATQTWRFEQYKEEEQEARVS